jgi:hypothetical protein
MATTYTQLANTKTTGDTLAATEWNDTTAAVDRIAVQQWKQRMNGVLAGWALTSGLSTVTSGQGLVGPCFCQTTASQSISNLAAGSTNYVYAVTDADSAHSGTVDFKARTVSGAVTNYDALTSGVLVGKGVYATGSGFTSVNEAPRQTFPVYRRVVEEYIAAGDLVLPAESGAQGTTVAGSTTYTALKFPASSVTQAFWPVRLRAGYSGQVRVTTHWLSTGATGTVKLDVDAAVRGDAEAWDAAPVATGAGGVVTVGGTSGNMAVLTGTWASGLGSAGELATIRLRRSGTGASDTMGTAYLLGVALRYSTQL